MTRVFLGNFVPGSVMFTSEFDFLQAAVSRVTSCGLELYSSRGELILFRFSVYFVRDDLIFRVLLTRSVISRWLMTSVSVDKHATFVPHTAGRYSVKRFRKAQCPIVERLTNSLMMHGRNNGKKLMAVRIVKHAMEIIHLLTDQNPIQVIVDAIINRYVLLQLSPETAA
jgi:hypothetical protein